MFLVYARMSLFCFPEFSERFLSKSLAPQQANDSVVVFMMLMTAAMLGACLLYVANGSPYSQTKEKNEPRTKSATV